MEWAAAVCFAGISGILIYRLQMEVKKRKELEKELDMAKKSWKRSRMVQKKPENFAMRSGSRLIPFIYMPRFPEKRQRPARSGKNRERFWQPARRSFADCGEC